MKVLITRLKHAASFELAFLLKSDEVLFGDHFADFPDTTSNAIAHQILKFCLDHHVERVFPLALEEVVDLRKSTVLFEEFGIEMMISETLKIANGADKQANSFVELSTGLIALGYPNKKIAIADASGRGELILIDDAVKDNLQIWGRIKSMSFNQIGKWFNQVNFSMVDIYQLEGEIQEVFVLICEGVCVTLKKLDGALYQNLQNLAQKHQLKGFYSVVFVNQTVLRIINATY